MMEHITITDLEDIGNGQSRCTVTLSERVGDIPAGVYDNFIVGADDGFGLGPMVRAKLLEMA